MFLADLGERRQLQAFGKRIDDDLAGHQVFFHRADAVHRAVQTGDGGDGQIGVELARKRLFSAPASCRRASSRWCR
jgi:hypothetical protein